MSSRAARKRPWKPAPPHVNVRRTAPAVTAVAVAPDPPVATAPPDRASGAPRRAGQRRVLLAGALLALQSLGTHVVGIARVSASSMQPTLHHGDLLLVDRMTYRFRSPHIGEVVVTSDPRTGDPIVKRIVGVAGDRLEIVDGVLQRNGADVDEPYIDRSRMAGWFSDPVTVPSGHVYVLGDNRGESTDSRTFGPIDVDDVEGRVLAHS